MLNLRYEYVECMTKSKGRKDRSLLCPVALTLQFQCVLEVQCSQTCDSFFRNTRILLYTPATVSLFLLKRFINSSVLPSLYYLASFFHICAIPLSPTHLLVFHQTNSPRRSQFSPSFFSFSSYYFLSFRVFSPFIFFIHYLPVFLYPIRDNDTGCLRLFPTPADKCRVSILNYIRIAYFHDSL